MNFHNVRTVTKAPNQLRKIKILPGFPLHLPRSPLSIRGPDALRKKIILITFGTDRVYMCLCMYVCMNNICMYVLCIYV